LRENWPLRALASVAAGLLTMLFGSSATTVIQYVQEPDTDFQDPQNIQRVLLIGLAIGNLIGIGVWSYFTEQQTIGEREALLLLS
jgi:hypothetical protein